MSVVGTIMVGICVVVLAAVAGAMHSNLLNYRIRLAEIELEKMTTATTVVLASEVDVDEKKEEKKKEDGLQDI